MADNLTTEIEPFLALEIFAQARAMETSGQTIHHLEVGEPARLAAPKVIAAAQDALKNPLCYTHSKGLLELRQELAAYYLAHHKVEIDPERIVITTGSSSGFVLTYLTAFEPGARVAVTRPGYPAYMNILKGLNFEAVEIELSPSNGWRLTAKDIEAAHAKKPFAGLLFASPANPTGAVIPRSELAEIIAVCARLNIRLISDEIYHNLDYTGPSVSVSEISANPIIVNSFSKYYSMTGWRLGWVVFPEDLVRRAEVLQQSMFISTPTLSQIAACTALKERDYCDGLKARYAANRKILVDGLTKLGFEGTNASEGAFYIYADASKFTNDTSDFCKRLLRDAGVATTPGVDFDRVNGHRYVRFSFAGAEETMTAALDKISKFLTRPNLMNNS